MQAYKACNAVEAVFGSGVDKPVPVQGFYAPLLSDRVSFFSITHFTQQSRSKMGRAVHASCLPLPDGMAGSKSPILQAVKAVYLRNA